MQNLTHIHNNFIFRILKMFRTLAYIEPNAYFQFRQTSKVKPLSKIVKANIFSKHSILGNVNMPPHA